MVIDTHVHIDEYTEKFHSPQERLQHLKQLMKESKVEKALIIQEIEATYKPLSANQILTLIKKEKNLFLIATLNIKYTKKEYQEIEQLLKTKKVKGIKLYPGYESFYPTDKRCDLIYDLCEKYDIPVIFHSGDTHESLIPIKYAMPIHIDEVACKRRNLKIIIAHLGNPWIDDTMMVLSRHKNVYADIY